MKKVILSLSALSIFTFFSCQTGDDGGSTSTATQPTTQTSSTFTGKYKNETNGYVTFYNNADSDLVAYYVPELEAGWYHCAVSEPKLSEIPPGSAIELSANGKTIHLLVTDLCPNSTNSHHTSKTNYFFDLEKTAFTTLASESVGVLNMKFKIIPYPTSKNIGFYSTDTEEWYLQGSFYNMRYPLKKIEYSLDGGTTFEEMKKVSSTNKNNLQCINGKKIPSKITFRLTDIYNNILTTRTVSIPTTKNKVDLGVNFQ